ncbi:MAG TPA: hypothetical protein VFM94_05985 [Solirubrobacterales bacterium]|nr:hypothetical protein [Solirubrobacterales bacterium]
MTLTGLAASTQLRHHPGPVLKKKPDDLKTICSESNANNRYFIERREVGVLGEHRGVVAQGGCGDPGVVTPQAAAARQLCGSEAREAACYLGINW